MQPLLKDSPEFQEFIRDAEHRLRESAEALVPTVISKLLSDGDIMILSLMGIDARSKILDVFIEQCTKLKKELDDELI